MSHIYIYSLYRSNIYTLFMKNITKYTFRMRINSHTVNMLDALNIVQEVEISEVRKKPNGNSVITNSSNLT